MAVYLSHWPFLRRLFSCCVLTSAHSGSHLSERKTKPPLFGGTAGETCLALPPLPGTFSLDADHYPAVRLLRPDCQEPPLLFHQKLLILSSPSTSMEDLKVYLLCQAPRSSVHGLTFCTRPASSASMAFQRHANLKGLQRGALRKQSKNRLGRALAAVVRSELSRMGFVGSSCFVFYCWY